MMESSHCFFISEDFDSSGCWFGFEIIFFGYSHCSNSLVHQVCTSVFQGFLDQESHSQLLCFFLFPRRYGYRGCFYFHLLSLLLILEFRRCQLFSGPRLLRRQWVLALLCVHSRIRCWTPWKKPLLEIWAFRIPEQPSRYSSSSWAVSYE